MKVREPSPIALFVYNRLKHTRQTIEALLKNDLAKESELIIFSDGPRTQEAFEKVEEVRKYIRSISGFKRIQIRDRKVNLGLAKSIIDGVTEIVNEYGRVIVLEDDLVTSPYFLNYMNDGLNFYENEQKVISILGYVYPVKNSLPETFFIKGAFCWGWATWKRGWDLFEKNGEVLLKKLVDQKLTNIFDCHGTYPYTEMLKAQIKGENDSWGIRWNASAFLNNKLTLFPGVSLVSNIGNEGSGRHGVVDHDRDVDLAERPVHVKEIEVIEHDGARKRFEDFFRTMKRPSLNEMEISMKTKDILYQMTPPILWKGMRSVWHKVSPPKIEDKKDKQDLDLYWDKGMADLLETWGEGNAWTEIKFIMVNCKGKILDIACGTGKTMEILKVYPNLELYGCDISDFLIQKAFDRGILKERLKVCDATKSGYDDNAFDYSYSIGSLEHFTLEGITQFIEETYRITKHGTYHMMPVSRSGKDEGWMKTYQSFHNNSVAWWENQFRRMYKNVYVIDSKWEDGISVGKWFICFKE